MERIEVAPIIREWFYGSAGPFDYFLVHNGERQAIDDLHGERVFRYWTWSLFND